jgi:hypothetical protein
MAISGKVSAASVGAATATLVSDIVARHAFHGQVPGDVLALVGGSVTAAVTFVCGYLAKHVPTAVKAEVGHVAEMALAQVADEAPLYVPSVQP